MDPADFLTVVGSGTTGDLRYAIAQADATAGEDAIVFSLPAYSTITLGQAMRPITDPAGLFIRGDTATNLTISGGNAVRVFFVTNNAVLGVNDLTIANGLARGGNGSNGGGGDAGLGGGLLIDSGIVSLPADIASDLDRLARFRKEVAAARKVSHPNVCRVYDIAEHEGQSFLTMEFVDGEDLSSVLKRLGRVPEE